MKNVQKRPNIFYKSCGVHTAKFVKNDESFFNIMHELFNLECNDKSHGIELVFMVDSHSK